MTNNHPKILIAGIGNELRQDDAFGMILASRILEEAVLHENIKVIEAGSAGIHLVQELYDKYDMVVILDTVQWGDAPGTVSLKEIEVKDVREMPTEQKNSFFADMHYINPVKALMMAKALNIIPEKVYFLGCEAADIDDIDVGMSPVVLNAIPVAYNKLIDWINSFTKNKTNAVK